MTRPTVLAFGGNAILPDPSEAAIQERTVDYFALGIKHIISDDAGLVLVHGNGPQVGMILLRIEATRDSIPPETLDILVAETQGSIGYLLAKALRNRIPKKEIAAVLTQVEVDREDPAFANPSKPVGPFYSRCQAEALRRDHRWQMAAVEGRGWRRVVPSPKPKKIIEIHAIRDAISHNHIIIAGGGGGIPVVQEEGLRGIEAVIDKDYTACLIAAAINAERLIILTDVPHVSTGFGKEFEKPIDRLDTDTARRLLALGEFPPGSMGPKVEASACYTVTTGHSALITNVEKLSDALRGRAGTWIDP